MQSKMGVGAIFVSTLAKHRLPTPNYPPKTQTDYLTASLQPIIAFIVLCSIIIRTCLNRKVVNSRLMEELIRWLIHPFLLSRQTHINPH
jgi:hypothetical protein